MEHIPTLSDRGNDVMRGWEAHSVPYEDYKLISVVQVVRSVPPLQDLLGSDDWFFVPNVRLQADTDNERLVETWKNWVPTDAESNWLP